MGNSEVDLTAADSLCMQRGFREGGWDYMCTDGRLINKIIKDAITVNPPVYGRLKKFFSTKDGGTKKSNNTIYGHYKTEASEYITSAAHRGVDLRQHTCRCGRVPAAISSNESCSTHTVVATSTEKFANDPGARVFPGTAQRGTGLEEAEEVRDNYDADGDANIQDAADAFANMSMKSPAGAPPSAKKVSEYECAIKYLLDRMPIATSMDGGKRGYKFDCMCPFVWYSYYVVDCFYVKYEFLTWYAAEQDVDVLVSNCGMFLNLHNKILESFLRQQHVQVQFAGHIPPNGDPNDLLVYQAANHHFKDIHEMAGNKPIQPMIEIPLPFQCQKDPYCPYDQVGMRVLQVPHDYYSRAQVPTAADIRKFQIISVSLVGSKSHHNQATKEETDIDF
jgi:hypothetical protein